MLLCYLIGIILVISFPTFDYIIFKNEYFLHIYYYIKDTNYSCIRIFCSFFYIRHRKMVRKSTSIKKMYFPYVVEIQEIMIL